MKTNKAARRVWKLRIGLACLAVATLASFNLWAGSYCLRNHAKTVMPPSSTQQVWHGSVTGSEVFLAIR